MSFLANLKCQHKIRAKKSATSPRAATAGQQSSGLLQPGKLALWGLRRHRSCFLLDTQPLRGAHRETSSAISSNTLSLVYELRNNSTSSSSDLFNVEYSERKPVCPNTPRTGERSPATNEQGWQEPRCACFLPRQHLYPGLTWIYDPTAGHSPGTHSAPVEPWSFCSVGLSPEHHIGELHYASAARAICFQHSFSDSAVCERHPE